MIPNNISENHVKLAIQEINKNGIPNGKRKSREYHLSFEGKIYPPKYIISKANEYANNVFLTHDKFNSKEARNYLSKLKFTVEKKNSTIIDAIENAIGSDFIQSLIQTSQFYFQHLLNVKDRYRDFELNVSEIHEMLDDYRSYNEGTFEDFVETQKGKKYEFLNIVGEYISYLDEKASGKNNWNKYPDNRIVARANVRQNDWVNHLLKYKDDPTHEFSHSIGNAVKYSFHPMEELTILSENHREKISEKILNKQYNHYKFTEDLINFFEQFDIVPGNRMNYTFIISSILYDSNVEPLWISKNNSDQDIFQEYQKYLNSKYSKERAESTYNSVSKRVFKIWKKRFKIELNTKDFSSENLLNLYDISRGSYDGTFRGKWSFQEFLGELIKELYNNILRDDNVFDYYREFLENERENELTRNSVNTYVIDCIKPVSGCWKSNFNTDIENELVNKYFVRKLVKIKNKYSSFKGSSSFSKFISELEKSFLAEQNQINMNVIYYGPPGTGKTFKIIEEYISTSKTTTERADDTKQFVNLKKGFWHLAPGEGGYLWDDLKKSDFLGYEYCGHYLGDLSKIDREEASWDMKQRFSKVKKGDYFCIISGKKFYAIAEAEHDYNPEMAKNDDFDFQTIKVKWIKQFQKPELLNVSSLQAFSNLKGSKRWESLLEALKEQDIYPENQKGEIIKKHEENYKLISFHQSFGYEDFIEGIKPNLDNSEDNDNTDIDYIIQDGIFKIACDKAVRLAGYTDLITCVDDTKENRIKNFKNAEPFYLLIDEINRGNISSIFGELITLIENDKRLGNEHELTTYLPYSKEKFGVPANLKIIGTMNTADRSVESLDTALRRRFSFIEVAPNTDVIKEKHISSGIIEDEIDLVQILNSINERIELLLDKDHKIGHSYFLQANTFDDLKGIFFNKIIPLLEEYFYGDYGKLGLVIGKEFVKEIKGNKHIEFADFNYDDKSILKEKSVYKINSIDEWTKDSFISIYNPKMMASIEK